MKKLLITIVTIFTYALSATEEDWHKKAKIISVWPLSQKRQDKFKLDINGVWTWHTTTEIKKIHDNGKIAISSLQVYAGESEFMIEHPELKNSVSKDIFGNKTYVSWYEWEKKPVVGLSINSPAFQSYILEAAEDAIKMDTDSIFLDEIQTSSSFISREKHGAGFGYYDIQYFNQYISSLGYKTFFQFIINKYLEGKIINSNDLKKIFKVSDISKLNISNFLAANTEKYKSVQDNLFIDYKNIQEQRAFKIIKKIVANIRTLGRSYGKEIVIGANVAGEGMPLTNWATLMDYVVFENERYNLSKPKSIMLYPNGSFLSDYKLGKAIVPGFCTAFPKLELVNELRKNKHENYLALMFSEAIAAGGNWGIGYWNEEYHWPEETFNPDSLSIYTEFYSANKKLYESPPHKNNIVVVYNNQSKLTHPFAHESYVGLVDLLSKHNIQFDVIFTGDNTYERVPLSENKFDDYDLILYPNAQVFLPENISIVKKFINKSVFFGSTDQALGNIGGHRKMSDFGLKYLQNPTNTIIQNFGDALIQIYPNINNVINVSDSKILAITKNDDEKLQIHFVNQSYDKKTDSVILKNNIEVLIKVPNNFKSESTLKLAAPGKNTMKIDYVVKDGFIHFVVPFIDIYAVAIFS